MLNDPRSAEDAASLVEGAPASFQGLPQTHGRRTSGGDQIRCCATSTLGELLLGGKPRKFFKPDAADVLDLEARLPNYLRKHAPVSPNRTGKLPLAERAPGYMRQYYGYVDPRGTRRIWANFFCWVRPTGPPGYWRTEAVVVADGGDCFFNVEFRIETRSFEHLSINGETLGASFLNGTADRGSRRSRVNRRKR